MVYNDGSSAIINIKGPRRIENMFERIDNIATILKYLAISSDNSIKYEDPFRKDNCDLLMDRNMNIISPLITLEDLNNVFFMNHVISWSMMLKLEADLTSSDKWKEIKSKVDEIMKTYGDK